MHKLSHLTPHSPKSTNGNNLLSRTSFYIQCCFFSDLDENWTDLPQKLRSYTNRLYWISYGQASVIVDEQEIILEPGYLYLIPTGCMLNLKAEQKFGKYWCHFISPSFNGFDLLEMVSTPSKLKPDNPDQIETIFKNLVKATKQENSGWQNIQNVAWLLELLLPFFREAKKAPEQEGRAQFRSVLQYIQSSIDQTIKVEDLAEILGWSPSYFAHRFTKEFNCSPVQYLIQKRVQLAQRMLCLSNKQPKEIGYLCGFNSASRFSKTFLQVSGRTPLKFRETFRSKTPPSEAFEPHPEKYGTEKFARKRLKWVMLRSSFDWLYCNILYRVLSSTYHNGPGIDWQHAEEATSCNTIFMATEGAGSITTNGITTSILPGELHLIPCGSSLALHGGLRLHLHQCCFAAEQTDGSDLLATIKPPSRLIPKSAEDCVKLFKALESRNEEERAPWHTLEQMALLLQLLIPFLQAAEEQPRDHALFTPALLYIKDNLHHEITLEDLAATMGQSAEHFARSFRDALKIPPMHYVTEERIQRAKKLLTETTRTAREISEQCGFNTPSHFAKVFKKITGLPPGKFRKL